MKTEYVFCPHLVEKNWRNLECRNHHCNESICFSKGWGDSSTCISGYSAMKTILVEKRRHIWSIAVTLFTLLNNIGIFKDMELEETLEEQIDVNILEMCGRKLAIKKA